jgi:organic hydroperoxide reductase OsmC/OhrA
MSRRHKYETTTVWNGDRGRGTADYRAYERLYDTTSVGRPTVEGSSDPAFRGDPQRWNPELLFVAALSQCHLLAYLHRCAIGGVTVTGYRDTASGVMLEDNDDGGHFEEVVLRPVVTVAEPGMVERAMQLHKDASERCFIASSVSFPVRHEPQIVVSKEPQPAVR